MKLLLLNTIYSVFLLFVTTSARAGGGAVAGGGGSYNEADLFGEQENYTQVVSKIRSFFALNDQELEPVFPEFESRQLLEASSNVSLKVVDRELTDDDGVAGRTCLHYKNLDVIECDINKLVFMQDNPKAQFVLMLHEILGLMGLEETSPQNPAQIDGYKISKKIAPYLTKVANWDLELKEAQKASDTETVKVEVAKNVYNWWIFKNQTKGVKDAALKEALMQCYEKYHRCQALKHTYQFRCVKSGNGSFGYYDRCTGSVYYKGSIRRSSAQSQAFISDYESSEIEGLSSNVQKKAYYECKKSGFTVCDSYLNYTLKIQDAMHPQGSKFLAKSFVMGKDKVSSPKDSKKFESKMERCGDADEVELVEFVRESALNQCRIEGYRSCKVVADYFLYKPRVFASYGNCEIKSLVLGVKQ